MNIRVQERLARRDTLPALHLFAHLHDGLTWRTDMLRKRQRDERGRRHRLDSCLPRKRLAVGRMDATAE